MTTATMEKPTATMQEEPLWEAEGMLEARSDDERTRVPDELYGRARKAAARFLELQGYEILDRDWPCDEGVIDIVCWDGETLVFADVQTRFDGFPDGEYMAARRAQLEAMALAYLGENDYTDVPVRFDVLGLIPVGADRAFLRHHVNALGMM